MRTLSYIVREIIWWWEKRHNPLASLPSWKAAREAELRARRRGCTRAIGKARKDMGRAVLADLAEAKRRRDAFAELKRRDPVSAERIEQTGMV